jgi:UDP-glucose 4-epimerase
MIDWVAIIGGSGYIGSHVAAALKRDTKHKILIIDQKANQLPNTHIYADKVVNADYTSEESFMALKSVKPIAIVHCAALNLVTPSVTEPAIYYENNVCKLMAFMDHLRKYHYNNVIFRSSSNVYGNGNGIKPFSETDLLNPINPYGKTKLTGEMLLADYSAAYGINSIAFRFFNAVGAEPKLNLGQPPNASHVLARIMDSLITDTEFVINGDDWPTPDGTAIRDYIHVRDIANAHIMGIGWLLNNPGHYVYNIGSGTGYSVKEILSAVERVTCKTVKTVVGPRRSGDPAWRIADISKIKMSLGWKPLYDLDAVVLDVYNWYTSTTYTNMCH